METLFNFFKYVVGGFFGLILLLVLVTVVFGKRIRKKWEFEADFRDAAGREFGEFEIELSRIDKEEPDYTIKTKFRMRHPALIQHATVQVYIDKTLVFENMVEIEGRMFVRNARPLNPVDKVSAGQTCRVLVGGTEITSAEFHPD